NHPGNNLSPKPGAVKDPEMSDRGTIEVVLVLGGDTATELKGHTALARPGDIVFFTLNGHQAWMSYIRQPNRTVARSHEPTRQQMPEKGGVQCLQIELGSEVHHRKILVVKLPVLSGGVAVAMNEMREHFSLCLQMAVEIHQHEAGELQEPRVDLAAAAARRPWHLRDDGAPEPLESPLLRQVIDGRGIDARVDRPAGQHERARDSTLAGSLHECRGGNH